MSSPDPEADVEPAERAIAVAPGFERVWPLVAPRLRELWPDAAFVRSDGGTALSDAVPDPAGVTQLVGLGLPVEDPSLPAFERLEAATVLVDSAYAPDAAVHDALAERGVTVHWHDDEAFWSQSVGEHALGLTLAALRRTPQLHARMERSTEPWDYEPEGRPGPDPDEGRVRGHQYGDDPRFASGTLARKRVRVVGVGNIGSRYADAAAGLGADVAAYDPYADGPCFHRAGARQVHSLPALVADAEVFAPLVPPTPETEGLIDADLVAALPEGTLVVLATRARIVDGAALRERVLAGELALAADVFDGGLAGEPVAPDDPLLDCEHVVHTPHVAGRTEHANRRWAEMLLARFDGGVDPGDGHAHAGGDRSSGG